MKNHEITILQDRIAQAQVLVDQAYEFAFDNVATKPKLCRQALENAETALTEAEIDLALALGDSP